MNESLLKNIKAKELEIFSHFLLVCKKLNLKYYIISGTLLGAVKYGGFIPWDDDIDVAMPRKDYEEFALKAAEFLPTNFFVQTFKSDPNYPLASMKIRNSNTTFSETSYSNLSMNKGIYIDIFPIDNFTSQRKKQKRALFKIKIFKTSIGSVLFRKERPLFLRVKQIVSKILVGKQQKATKKFDSFMQSFPASDTCFIFCHNYGLKESCPWFWFGEGKKLKFEGIDVVAPAFYDELLKQVFGDYKLDPPLELQKPHHDVTIIDCERSYLEYSK